MIFPNTAYTYIQQYKYITNMPFDVAYPFCAAIKDSGLTSFHVLRII